MHLNITIPVLLEITLNIRNLDVDGVIFRACSFQFEYL